MNVRLLIGRLAEVNEYVVLSKKLAGVRGWLQELEAFALYLLAAEGPAAGAIVEIGSFMGRSTIVLATGSMSSRREKVTAVDHFRGSPEHQINPALVAERVVYNHFMQNLRKAGVAEHVQPIIASSQEAVAGWQGPIRLLFIDADHAYESTKQDFQLWSPFVVPGGLIAFHDVGSWPGVTQFYNELLGSGQGWEQILLVQTLRVVQKQ
jgi:predicted O-methyltransferase YrrM